MSTLDTRRMEELDFSETVANNIAESKKMTSQQVDKIIAESDNIVPFG